ncbi:Gfo/Idh/MocA family protein [Kistimonas asteriae]|uniref:Gfo/Idh/MocA family protein n=1 Tax=Kistimonas asteriae TaxID=517724 RepID=UPI001BA87EAF|nr:Gfo/Idh/MocA family oxidoreductase [Kistimonas asteriae]
MSKLRLGIVGSGLIAGVIADAVKQVEAIELVAVASRRSASATVFAKEHGITTTYNTWQDMLSSDAIDAVYIATPTACKEEIALFGAENRKHLLVEKPFASVESLQKIITAAGSHGVAFMDATHFSHNPRTQQIRDDMVASIGEPQAVRSSFFFPLMDKSNIRFNPEKEPTGAVGDMGWYSMRAITEYLQPATAIATIAGGIVRDDDTGAVIRGSGVVVFEDGKSSTFDFGYSIGVCVMDLDILGHEGMVSLSDFVLDWKNSFAFDEKDHINGYIKRCGMVTPKDFEFVIADSEEPQEVSMMRHFAAVTADPSLEKNQQAVALTLKTQDLLDSYRSAVK